MSVMEIRAVAVLDKPKFKLPSMSVAWTMMVYCDTFCKKETEKEKTYSGTGISNAAKKKKTQNKTWRQD